MNKGEWIGTYALMPAPVGAGIVPPGEYMVTIPEGSEIIGVVESHSWIMVVVKSMEPENLETRKMHVLGDGQAIEYQYTKYIGSVNISDISIVGENAAWRHIFEVTRPNDDNTPVKDDGKTTFIATPGC